MSTYYPEKLTWTEADFRKMLWHDVTIWGSLAIPDLFEFVLDVDYMFQWVAPERPDGSFNFWISPATVVFHNAHTMRIDAKAPQGTYQIAEAIRGEPTLTPNSKMAECRYTFDCQEGALSLTATGFTMFVRRQPVLLDSQILPWSARGIPFGRLLEP